MAEIDLAANERVRAYNEGLLNGLHLARAKFEACFAGLLEEIERTIVDRKAAYDLRVAEPMCDVEAGARALCVVIGLDPLKPMLLPDGEHAPLWTFRADEARACLCAALAAPRNLSPDHPEHKGNAS